MAIGYNNLDLEAAAEDLYKVEKPLMGVFISETSFENYRANFF
jgi:hypothetical protein